MDEEYPLALQLTKDATSPTFQLMIRLAQRYDVSWEAMSIWLRNWPLRLDRTVQEAFERGLASLP